jgi:hypothetical protein
MEFEPKYVDAAIGRWQQMTKLEATLAGDGRTFEEIAAARGGATQPPGLRRQRNQEGQPCSAQDRSPGGQPGRDSESRHA